MDSRYQEVVSRIETARRFGKKPGAAVSAHMMEALGHPEAGLPYLHVAGTNGKGSVCAFLDSILRKFGLTVGRFTSPHLVEFEERIAVNGKQIAKEDVARLGEQLLGMDFDPVPTMFDYCLAMAELYFREQGCDIAVIETGLGGRLDSTNALGKPLAAVITRIGYDHTAVLGDTLGEIAAEKAGILKEGVPAVFAPQVPEAMQVLTSCGGTYHVVTEEEIARARDCGPGLPGAYQWENAAVAAAAIRMLRARYAQENAPIYAGGDACNADRTERNPNAPIYAGGDICNADRTKRNPNVPRNAGGDACNADRTERMDKRQRCRQALTREDGEAVIAAGLKEAVWHGRMELLSEHPFFLVDGAHNSSGVTALAASLKALWPGEKFHFVMGVMADKDYRGMIDLLVPLAEAFTAVTPPGERALDADHLAQEMRQRGVYARVLTDIRGVCALPKEGRKTVALGSLYFVGDILRIWQMEEERRKEYDNKPKVMEEAELGINV